MGGFPNPAPSGGTATIVAGSQTPADIVTNPTDCLDTESFEMFWNGSTWDRARSVSGADAGGNGTSGLSAYGRVSGFNGTTWDRLRSGLVGAPFATTGILNVLLAGYNGASVSGLRTVSDINNTAVTTSSALLIAPLGAWTLTSAPAANTQATASKAAGGGTVRHVCTGLSATVVATGASVAGPVTIVLRDGATGAGTILGSWLLNIPAGVGVPNVPLVIQGLNISGSANTAMTIESVAAGGANTQLAVNATGYSTP